MRKTTAPFILATLLAASGLAAAHAAEKELPAGPVRDRHDLMEHVGKNAKTIGDALKSGQHAPITDAARAIQADSAKVLALFPKGSAHPDSRAKDEIWSDWAKFEQANKDMDAKAGALAAAAESGGDVGAAGKAMFGTCKSCHDSFRRPDEDEKH